MTSQLKSYHYTDDILVEVAIGLIKELDNILSNEKQRNLFAPIDLPFLLDLLGGLVTGSTAPIRGKNVKSTSIWPTYIHLYTSTPKQRMTIQLSTLKMEFQIGFFNETNIKRAAWMTYILIRFCVRPIQHSLIHERLTRIAAHHGASTMDCLMLTRILKGLDCSLFQGDVVWRCDWWNAFTQELYIGRTDLAKELKKKFIMLADKDNITAYKLFTSKGGHQNSLKGTVYEHLEPILFASPSEANGLYISTIHILQEKLDSGSIFSDGSNDHFTPVTGEAHFAPPYSSY